MGKPNRKLTVEQHYQQGIKELLTKLFQEFGSQQAVADHLGVSQSTVSKWLKESGLSQKKLVIEKAASAAKVGRAEVG